MCQLKTVRIDMNSINNKYSIQITQNK